jgi:parallel beta-helix repeat protein
VAQTNANKIKVYQTEVYQTRGSRSFTSQFRKASYLTYCLLTALLFSLTACNTKPSANLESQVTLTFSVYRDGTSAVYHADSLTSSSTYTGTLKFVVQSAVTEANAVDSGTIRFQAGDFDLGPDWFELTNIADIIFEGQGMNATTLRNNASAATDTEPFDCTNCDRLTIRDLTVSAGGPLRSTSDALDFDGGDNIIIERVKVTSSRARGIIFDGKGSGSLSTADHNIVRDCIITGLPSNGIELLASNFNLIDNCTITDVAGTGILINKASSSALQPNKQSNDNTIINNDVINSGRDGIAVNSSNRNLIKSNIVLNSSDDVSSLDGIRIYSSDSIVCDDNKIDLNTASDNQTPKTQTYGLKIVSALCNRTVVGTNTLTGNRVGSIFNGGTGTIFNGSSDTTPPSVPAGLTAAAASSYQVNLGWTASSDNVGVTGYEIYRGGVALASVGTVTTYSDTTVSPSTTYSYQVRARDAAGNWSALSSAASATTPAATVLTFAPVADTYVQNDTPTTNYGSSSLLTVDGSPVRHLLFKFIVSGIGSKHVTKATLRLYNTNASATGGSFYRVSNSSWSETTVTWNTAPANDPTPFASLGAVAGTSTTTGIWYGVNLTPIITADGQVSIKVISANADAASYTSRNGAAGFQPQLIVEVAP